MANGIFVECNSLGKGCCIQPFPSLTHYACMSLTHLRLFSRSHAWKQSVSHIEVGSNQSTHYDAQHPELRGGPRLRHCCSRKYSSLVAQVATHMLRAGYSYITPCSSSRHPVSISISKSCSGGRTHEPRAHRSYENCAFLGCLKLAHWCL